MVNTLISVDLTRPIAEQRGFHNRWHWQIPPVVSVLPEEVFRIECFDTLGLQVKNDDSIEDVMSMDLSKAHTLSGPIEVTGAEPGDLLEVELLDIQPLPEQEWGYTMIQPPERGGSFLSDIFTKPAKAIWDFHGIYATSRHIPGVKFAGIVHPGVLGTAPSKELMEEWNRRELELINSHPGATPHVAYPPWAPSANVGRDFDLELEKVVKGEAPRTIPPRENGGNVDIKNLSRGSKTWLPVFLPGANLSVGDLHFSEGDGEISFCGAIEMPGAVTMRTRLIKNGVALHGLKNPIYMPGPVQPLYTRYLTFEGISVDEGGVQHSTDPKLSFRNAILNCIEYFKKFGYSGEQIYMLLSCCPCEGRIASIVDIPNACCTIGVPTEIFEFDVMPKDGGHEAIPRGQCAINYL